MFSGLNLAHAKSTAAPPPFAELSSRCACSLDRCYWDILLLFSCPACVAGGPTFPWFGLPCHNKLSRCWLRCRPCFRFFAWMCARAFGRRFAPNRPYPVMPPLSLVLFLRMGQDLTSVAVDALPYLKAVGSFAKEAVTRSRATGASG